MNVRIDIQDNPFTIFDRRLQWIIRRAKKAQDNKTIIRLYQLVLKFIERYPPIQESSLLDESAEQETVGQFMKRLSYRIRILNALEAFRKIARSKRNEQFHSEIVRVMSEFTKDKRIAEFISSDDPQLEDELDQTIVQICERAGLSPFLAVLLPKHRTETCTIMLNDSANSEHILQVLGGEIFEYAWTEFENEIDAIVYTHSFNFVERRIVKFQKDFIRIAILIHAYPIADEDPERLGPFFWFELEEKESDEIQRTKDPEFKQYVQSLLSKEEPIRTTLIRAGCKPFPYHPARIE